ncbi:MAG: tRNA uridine-5-carboxymethylaminomethyl(34) synthesis GTPase MnmE [bacterium]
MIADKDTIVAVATPPGRGGIGVIRLSGADLTPYFQPLIGRIPTPRTAHFCDFTGRDGEVIDQGIALYFAAPHSFTGENVLELQGHGGPVILDQLLERCVQLGARLARPGEFSERAFLNDKIDLAQAEAIADLIEAASRQAATGAIRSLQGVFSERIHAVVQDLIHLRTYVEAAIDFPEEEIDFLADRRVGDQLRQIGEKLRETLAKSRQGALLKEGMTIVLTGKPNAGKSSLLNALAGRESAIVTDIPGTTRDILREQINIDGMPLHIIDTAGLRESSDKIEEEGIRRAWAEIRKANLVLVVVDSTQADIDNLTFDWPKGLLSAEYFDESALASLDIAFVFNKVDLSGFSPEHHSIPHNVIPLSAKQGTGLDTLTRFLKQKMGYQGTGEGMFTARRRHVEALEASLNYLEAGKRQLEQHNAGELLAEDLRMAQNELSSITGAFTPDDLLGSIFSSFCIGK